MSEVMRVHVHVVRLGRLAPRVQERLGNPPVVRQEHQPRALLIEPPHGEHANGLHPTSPSLRTTSRASARVISARGVVGLRVGLGLVRNGLDGALGGRSVF